MKGKFLWLLLSCLMVVTFIVWSCDGTPSGQQEEEEGSSFLEMLQLIPDYDDTRSQVYISDHATIREIYDITLPSSDANEDAMEEYFFALAGDGMSVPQKLAEVSFISGLGPKGYGLHSPIRRQNIGFGPLDVDMDISAGNPLLRYEAIKGNFNVDVISECVDKCEASVMPEVGIYNGVMTYDWGPDTHLDCRLSPPAFDQHGQAWTISVQEDHVFRVRTIVAAQVMIDISQGQETLIGLSTLADNSDFSAMATALSEMGAYSCFLSDQWSFIYEPSYIDVLAASLGITEDEVAEAAGELPSIYRTIGLGIGEDEEGPFMTIVFVYNFPQEASSNVDVFKQHIENSRSLLTDRPWRDIISNSEVWAENRSLRAKLYGDIVFDWLDIYWARETLLWCGE